MNELSYVCRKKNPQEIPCEYAIEEFPEYQNPIKVTLVSSLEASLIVIITKKKKWGGGESKYNQFYHVLKKEKWIRKVWQSD